MKQYFPGEEIETELSDVTEYLSCTSFRALFDVRLRLVPDAPLYAFLNYRTKEKTEISSRQFKEQYDALCVFLQAQGYRRAHIAILSANSYLWLLTMQGIICSDNVAVLLDRQLEEERLLSNCRSSEATAVFFGMGEAAKARMLADRLGVKLYPLEAMDTYIAEGRALLAQGKHASPDSPPDCDALAAISYTSGTTGNSKGVMLSQRSMIFDAVAAAEQINLERDQLSLIPMNHMYATTAHLTTVISGGVFHICTNLRHMFEDLQTGRPDTLVIVPMIIEALYDALWKSIRANGREDAVKARIEENDRRGDVSDQEKRDMFKEELALFGGKLRRIVSGSAPLSMKHYEGFRDFGILIYEGYGITECAPVLSVNPTRLVKPGSVGQALRGVQVMIDDPNEEGEGEICAKGANVMQGYWRMDRETREAMRGGWFHTGDIGYADRDGFIYITGRIKNLIILSNGENVSPEEIEKYILQCAAVKEAVVYEKEAAIAAMIYPNTDAVEADGGIDVRQSIRDFISELNRNLPVYKRIHTVEFRDVPFERTSTNKIKRSFA